MIAILNRLLVEAIRLPFLLVWRYVLGWRALTPLPELDRFVIIGVPHTTNWDYLHMLAYSIIGRRRPHVTIKDSYMKPPLGPFVRLLGGIGIDRSKSNNMVEQMANMINSQERFMMVFTPEGTRGYRPFWKTGFYYTALQADVPIVCAYVNYPEKYVAVGLVLHPTGDIEADFAKLRDFYSTHGVGKYPENANDVITRAAHDETQNPTDETESVAIAS